VGVYVVTNQDSVARRFAVQRSNSAASSNETPLGNGEPAAVIARSKSAADMTVLA